jgi:glycosyltransferase involved in cell wall biosynthesis
MAALGLRERHPIRNWVAPRDLTNLAYLAGLEVVTERNELLLPVDAPALSRVVNGVVARLPGFRRLTASYWMMARLAPSTATEAAVSVIVPCRNEAGSIEAIVERVPDMGTATELIFVEGHSSDDTRERIAREIERRPDRDMRLVVQSGKGKGNAVREGFAAAKHDVLMIFDADLTVAPEDLPKFYDAIVSGRGELINGTRLIYEMESGAMRFLNLIGNKFFASLLSFVLGQYVKDTLCGTKVLRRSVYERIDAKRDEFVEEDPYGDFDLLLGAGLLGLKIVNIPVRYGARSYGETNIQRFSGGTLLLRLAGAGFRRVWIRALE